MFSRYSRAGFIQGGIGYGVSNSHVLIRNAIKNRNLVYETTILQEGQRLDHLSSLYYGDSSLWWILAAASGIGWGLQVPPGTIVNIPDLEQVRKLVT
jgi:hypothetical protein